MPGTSFDRVADIYDVTRGGERRGDRFADELAAWIVGPRVIELGVGTGVVAKGLGTHGQDVVGVDLSEEMLRIAHDRIGSRVCVTDVDRLPFADRDEIAPIVDRLAPLRQARLDHNALVVSDHPSLQVVHEGFTEWDEHETVPSVEADAIEQRIYSSLFDVDDATWERVVVPVIDALRALPDPDRPRRRRNRHPIVVWTVAAGV